MGYTIRIREKMDRYSMSHGPSGDVFRENKAPEMVNPPSFGDCLYSDLSGIDSDDTGRRVELFEDSNGTATDAEVFTACPYLKAWVIDQVKQIRKHGLDEAAKSAGVLAVYSENYYAAQAVLAGVGDSSITKDGKTATAYLAGFGARLGMNAAQFAAYIVAENRRVGPNTYQVEDEYLRLAYGVVPASQSVALVLAAPAGYRQFCGL